MAGNRDRRTGSRPVFRLPLARHRVQGLIDQEFAFHIEERIEGLVAAGMTRAQAEAEMRKRFGDYDQYRDETRQIDEQIVRERNRLDLVDALRQGARLAVRTLARSPAFTCLAVVTLALGIGATTSIYSVLDAVVLRPLPFREPNELVAIKHPVDVPGSGQGKWGLSGAGYHYVRSQTRTLVDLGAFSTFQATLVKDGDAQRVPAARVTASLVRVLEFRAAMGRTISEADDRPGAESVAMLSYEGWNSRFGADAGIVGKTVEVGGSSVRIVGVLAPGAVLPHVDVGASGNAGHAMQRVDIWFPFGLDPAAPAVNAHWLLVVGRMKPGVTRGQVQAELEQFVARFPELFPSAYSAGFIRDYAFRVAATPLRDDVVGSMSRVLWILLGAVVVVFIIAAANVANLFLVRAEVRRRETGIRSALGASRSQLAVHYMSESMLLALVAGVIGVAIAQGGLRALLALAPQELPRLDEVHLSGSTLAVAAVISIASGALFGLFPLSYTVGKIITLRDGGRGTTLSRSRRGVRGLLVIGQVALALVLLSAAGLMVRSMARLHAVRPGFDPDGVLAVDLPLPHSRYKSYEDVALFHRTLAERLAALPGVQSVGMGTGVPLDGFGGCAVVYGEGNVYARDDQPPCVPNQLVGPGYFKVLGIPVRGHVPDWSDLESQSGAVVITRALADRLWPGKNPIGRGVRAMGPTPPYYRVTGVIDELRATGLEQGPTEVVFYPIRPIAGAMLWEPPNASTVLVRTRSGDASALTLAIRRLVSELDPRVPVANVRTMDAVVRQSTARASFIMILLGIAAGMALLLSAVGLYGVISYVVTQRRAEIGVRMALGARVSHVSRLVVMESVRLALGGVIIGLLASLAINRLLSALLFETRPNDPLTLSAVALLLLLIAALASFAPARRASHVDPIAVLRDA